VKNNVAIYASGETVGNVRRWQAVISVFVQMLVSIVYSWSVFRGPLTVLNGWSKTQTITPYRYTLLMVPIGMIFAGQWLDRKGPKIVAATGAILMALGSLICAPLSHSVLGLVIGYGLFGGIGAGFVYVTPVANMLRWFPDKRGLMVGLAVMGSGLSSLFWGPLIERLIGSNAVQFQRTIPLTFVVVASIFFVGLLGASQLYRVPPAGWKPVGWTPPSAISVTREIGSREMLTTWQFYALWAVYFLGASAGLTAIGQAATRFNEVSSSGAALTAGLTLGFMGLSNAAGRFSWGAISDHVGRKISLLGMSAVSSIACLAFLRSASGPSSVVAGLCLAAFAYGGYLALMPALTADFYGSRNVGGNYGLMFSAYGLCGFVVPAHFEGILDRTRAMGKLAEGYRQVYLELAILALLSAAVASLLRPPKRENLSDHSSTQVPRTETV
jgi:MFS transporter, OFA family, oxalate/formate antiporter